MKNILIILSLLLFNCSKKETQIEGSVYIKLIDIGSFYGVNEENLAIIKNDAKNTDTKDSDTILKNYVSKLIKLDLLGKPSYKLSYDNSIVTVFPNEKDYKIVKENIKDLNMDKEEIILKLEGEFLSEDIFKSSKMISIKKTEGKTKWKK